MTINDATLSAFLDGELPPAEMEEVRQRLREDEQLSDRLAELAAVDAMISRQYSAIDDQPLPESVNRLLQASEPEAEPRDPSAKIVAFPLWRRLQRPLQQHAGIAAGLALVFGFALAQFTGTDPAPGDDRWQTLAHQLDTTPSGETVTLAGGDQLTPRLTFVNQQDNFCRQFQVRSQQTTSEQIACRTGGKADAAGNGTTAWELVASVRLDAVPDTDGYRTASGGSVLDSTLDAMIADGVLTPAEEKELISGNWKRSQP